MVQAQEEDQSAEVCIDEIPAPARDAILREVGGGTLMGVEEETWQNGQPAYEGRIHKGPRRIVIWVDAAGNILLKH